MECKVCREEFVKVDKGMCPKCAIAEIAKQKHECTAIWRERAQSAEREIEAVRGRYSATLHGREQQLKAKDVAMKAVLGLLHPGTDRIEEAREILEQALKGAD